ncbi:hypothetical protein [Streptomyces sp. sk2.1]|uniref:hypothetical protein n=1 Tax=Streptomyces sp. sk2.1 TaxID=2478959 RepID=UPI00141D4BB9|nr:hypothetical protein [Streptomyces sp. sk2.1]TXS80564.1 hypothetical protein EAO76_01875 [Streptomyces sp. sk2.1]
MDFLTGPLRVGQSVTFISERSDEHRLYLGEIKLIGLHQLVVESGDNFFTIQGDDMSNRDGENVVVYRTVLGLPSPPK